MRVFIAIEFSKEIKEYIYGIQQDMKNEIEKANFTNIENFHLTLKFIGEESQERVGAIKQAIAVVASRRNALKLATGEIGFFSRGNKKILWMGIVRENDLLEKLFSDLESELDKIGIQKEEKQFNPHITLAREATLREEFNRIKENIKLESKEILVEKISLMESTRINGKLIYLPLYTCEIGQ